MKALKLSKTLLDKKVFENKGSHFQMLLFVPKPQLKEKIVSFLIHSVVRFRNKVGFIDQNLEVLGISTFLLAKLYFSQGILRVLLVNPKRRNVILVTLPS